MPDENLNVDITSDLTSGDFDATAQNGQMTDTQVNKPDGTLLPHELPADTGTQGQSLRESLTKAFGSQEEQQTQQQPAPNVEQRPAPQLTTDADGKFRNLDGTFASEADVQAFKAAQEAPQTQAAPENAVQGLTPLEQEQFKALPTELQQYVARTTQALNERATRYNEYDQMEQIIGPRRALFAQDGMTPAVAMASLFQLSDFAARDPGQFVMWFAQQRGIDLDALLDEQDAQGPVNPVIAQLQQQVAALTQENQQQQTQQQQEAYAQRLQTVEQVAGEMENGVLKRPHFAELGDTILPFVDAAVRQHPDKSPAEQLAMAYDNACWAVPAIRAKLQQAAAPAPQNVPAQHAQRAQQAASSIAGGPVGDPSKSPDNSNRTLREELEYQVSQAS